MGKIFTRSAVAALVILAGIFALAPESQEKLLPRKKRIKKYSKQDRIDLAIAQDIEMTQDPALGIVPRDRLLQAQAYAKSLRETAKTTAAIAGVQWVERGPSNVSGRTRIIMVDPNDPSGNAVFAAGVAGGLWRTSNINAATPDWTPINDLLGNLAVTALVADPTNPQVMYFGTGEGYFNADAVRGLGIWKSLNGGNTWAQLPSTNNASFNFTQRLAITSTGIVLAATINAGLQRSTDGGATWARVLGTGLGITGAGNNTCWDVRVAANGDIYASLDGSLHKSTNNGATFGAAMTLPTGAARIEIACAPSDANYAYAILENGSAVNAIIRTTNGGTTWTSRTEPADADPGIPANDFSRGQAWYDLAIAISPTNRDRIFVGGIDIFASGDGGGTWTQLTHWYGGFGFPYAHADQHYITFQPGNGNIAYFGNDGGVYRTANAAAANPTLTFKGQNFNVTQFYACAMHPTSYSSYFLAGAQDNGSQQYSQPGMNNTIEASGGDGAFCHIDQNQPQYQITSYVYNDYFVSTNGGATFGSVTSGSTGRFINPTDYDDVNNRLYAARSANQYLRWDNPQTGNTFTTITVAALGGQVSAVRVSPNTNNRVFFGTGSGTVVRVDNAHTAAPTATAIQGGGMPTGYVSCIEVETGNDNHLLVTFSNYGVNSVWETFNGGTNWTSVEGNLPDMPIRWILLNPNNAAQALVATEVGVWSTDLLTGGATVWGPSNSGLANVRTDMLQIRTSDKLVIAATHGRGLYSSDIFTDPAALFDAEKHVIYTGKAANFIDYSYRATSWVWDFGDGSPTSNLQNPSHVYAAAGKYTVTLTINAGASSLTKTDFIHVLPDRGTPYAPADGGNFDVNLDDFAPENWTAVPWQRGNSAMAGKNGVRSAPNAWVTGLATTNYADNNNIELLGPSFNMTAAGTYTLSFYSKFNTEAQYDGFRVEYSLNKGDSWTPLGTVAAGWYNFANTTSATSFPINEPYFSGNVSAAYNLYSRDISFLAGNANVAFRFVFKSDISVTAPGVAVDDFSISGPVNAPSGLPIVATPLQGEWDGPHPTLFWQTFSESSNRGFQIERSADGLAFAPIGFVQGQGNSQATVGYSFTDQDILEGTWYYRFTQMDLNGSANHSNTVQLSKTMLPAQLFVSPSPFDDHLDLTWTGIAQGGQLAIRDAAGRTLYRADIGQHQQQHQWTGLAGLPKGVYFVTLTAPNWTATKKLLH